VGVHRHPEAPRLDYEVGVAAPGDPQALTGLQGVGRLKASCVLTCWRPYVTCLRRP